MLFRTLVLLCGISGVLSLVSFFLNDTVWEFDDTPATFGPSVPDKGLKGWLVVAVPDPYACSPLEIDIDAQRFVTLVKRGPVDDPCTFVDKVMHSQAAGAAAVIVYNYEDGLITMSGDNSSNVMIPSVFVSKVSGEKMLDLITGASEFDKTVVMLEPNKDDWEYENAVGYALVFIISTSLFMCVVCFGFYIYTNSRRPALDDIHPWKPTLTMDVEDVLTLPEVVIQASSSHIGESCSICLGDFAIGDRAKVLPCSHVFHNSCIIPWLTERNAICPLCKYDLQGPTSDPDFSYHAFGSEVLHNEDDEEMARSNSRRGASSDHNCPV